MPNIDPRTLAKAMKRMGVSQIEIPAEEVIIRTAEKEFVIANPTVMKVSMMGEESFQISGQVSERESETKVEITDEDIQTVVSQANCTEDKARETLEECNGDIAEAILKLKDLNAKPF